MELLLLPLAAAAVGQIATKVNDLRKTVDAQSRLIESQAAAIRSLEESSGGSSGKGGGGGGITGHLRGYAGLAVAGICSSALVAVSYRQLAEARAAREAARRAARGADPAARATASASASSSHDNNAARGTRMVGPPAGYAPVPLSDHQPTQQHLSSSSSVFAERGPSETTLAASQTQTATSAAISAQQQDDTTSLLTTTTSGGTRLNTDATPAPMPLDDNAACVVCLEYRRDALILPCRHLALCWPCAANVAQSAHRVCPVCRGPMQSVTHVFV
jgi:hypothetical protein